MQKKTNYKQRERRKKKVRGTIKTARKQLIKWH